MRDPGLPCQNPTTSYWQIPPHPVLSELQSAQLPSDTDVVIIGSGITSTSIAHHLLSADPTIRVVVLEARAVSSGATGRNGGHILELPYEEYDLQVALLGREQAKKLVSFRLSHLKELLQFSKTVLSAEAAADCEIRPVEIVDAVLEESVWRKVKTEVKHFLKDFPECEDEWKLWDKEEAQEVWSPCPAE
jgi:glycine/D-amino acid oxidase-like deaminating enzyme